MSTSTDLTKLTPAPWIASEGDVLGPPDECFLFHAANATETDVEFVALARNAFALFLAGWSFRRSVHGFVALLPDGEGEAPERGSPEGRMYRDNPYSAVVDAANVKAKPAG